MSNPRSATVVIFGATGDLAVKKLFPALSTLLAEGALTSDCSVIAISRRDWDTEAFRAFLRAGGTGVSEALLAKIEYLEIEFEETRGYEALARRLSTPHTDETLLYLSLSPKLAPSVCRDLHETGILVRGGPKLMLEKPFGTDEASARAFHEMLASVLDERQIYPVDHYLGKAAVQEVMRRHEASTELRAMIRKETVSRVLAELLETKGIDGRATYDAVGAFRDVGQNHLLEALAVLLAEYPANGTAFAWQNARAAVLKSLAVPHDIAARARRGQYDGYLAERGVAPDSRTETAFEVMAAFEGGELAGVPVTLRAAKRAPMARALLRIVFKDVPHVPKELHIDIQPEARIRVLERDGTETVTPLHGARDAYASVFFDALHGTRHRFPGPAEIFAAWRFTDTLLHAWHEAPLERYSEQQPFFR